MDKLDKEALHSDYQGEDDLDREALNWKDEWEDEDEEEEERDLSECPVCGFVNVSLEKELNNGRCFNCDSPLE